MKKKQIIHFFVILLTSLVIVCCKSKPFHHSKIDGKNITITSEISSNENINAFVAPYTQHINKDLNTKISFATVTFDKSKGQWHSNIGNLFALATYEMGNPVFKNREKLSIDMVMLNHGGIRAIISKGDVTIRTAFDVMPFENSLYIVGLSSKEIYELANYMLSEKKPHPLYGIEITVNGITNTIENIKINNQPIEDNKIYYVATSDYLANGGDSMTFFSNSNIKYDLDYKIRNILIDYFKKHPTLSEINSQPIIFTN